MSKYGKLQCTNGGEGASEKEPASLAESSPGHRRAARWGGWALCPLLSGELGTPLGWPCPASPAKVIFLEKLRGRALAFPCVLRSGFEGSPVLCVCGLGFMRNAFFFSWERKSSFSFLAGQ